MTFVPSWITKRSFDEPDDGELFTDETGDITIAVFVPVSFLAGITGQLYRQFTITIAVSVFTLSDFCQIEKLKAPAESSRSTIPQ